MDEAKYFHQVSNVILDKNNSYGGKNKVANVKDKRAKFDRRKPVHNNGENGAANSPKIN
jgi:hypothetical protein